MTLQDKERWGGDTALVSSGAGPAERRAVGSAADVSVLIPDRRFSRRDLRADRMISRLGS